ncbi:hypothetical protein Trydic_g18366 [Trypoxylus dichotomus]
MLLNYVAAENFHCKVGLCNENQHCCFQNKCCNNFLDFWIVWLGLIIICFMSTIILIIRCLISKPPRGNRYNRLSTDEC